MNKICKEPLFDFHLDLIDECESPKGKITDNWFYLTSGYYRIVAGDNLLFNYWKQKNITTPLTLEKNYPSYVSYFVSRLWEDLIEMLPIIREPLPQKLVPIIDNPSRWQEGIQRWVENCEGDEDKIWDTYMQGGLWLDARRFDNGYLDPGTYIFIYLSEDNMINLIWDNRDITIQDLPAWSAQYGKFSLTKNEFFEEVQLFNDRFMNQMEKRIEWITNNCNNKDTHAALENEQKSRLTMLSEGLNLPINKEDFNKVFDAIEKMGIGYDPNKLSL